MSLAVANSQLPVLQIIVPLIAALLCSLLRSGRTAWAFALSVNAACLYLALKITHQVMTTGVMEYDMGGWPAPFGISYRIDSLNVIVLLLITLIGTLTMCYARASVEKEIPKESIPIFYATYLLCFTGLLGIAITGDAFNVFVFLEVSSLSTYALVAMGKDRRALTSAYRYLVMGTIAATFILIGIGLLYMQTGTLNMIDLHERLPNATTKRSMTTAFAFLTVGISLKLALFPMHRWLPNAYTFSPTVISIFIASTATKVALYLLLRFFFTIFGREFSVDTMHLHTFMLPLSLAAVVFASMSAIFKTNLKRMLAYSSIAQIGYMSLGIALNNEAGLTASIVHLFNHGLMKGTLFMAVGCIFYRTNTVQIHELHGIGRRMPWTCGAFIIGGLSIIGVPLTAGFISKWYLVLATLENHAWPITAIVLFSSLLAVFYIWRVVETAFFHPPAPSLENVKEAPLSLLIPTWVLALGNIYFGINTDLTVGIAKRATEALLKGGP